MNGIDISSFQADLDFSTIDAEVCIIKATEGITYVNPALLDQYNKARAKGMKIGFYHFIRANDPVQEAKFFLDIIKDLQSDCKYFIDAENRDEAIGVSARIRIFADYLISQGKEVALYTDSDFYEHEILDIDKDLPLWVANYSATRPDIKSIGWQYSDSNGDLDLDVFEDGILLTKHIATPMNYIEKVEEVPYDFRFLQRAIEVDEDNRPGPITLSKCPLTKKGDINGIVSWIQVRIAYFGFDPKSADGNFGNDTLKAVCAFQRDRGLKDDGEVGPNTWKKLLGL